MKKLALFLLFFSSTLLHAEVKSYSQFSGLNTDASTLILINGQTPDSQNVLTDLDPSIQGRQGNVIYSTESSRGMWSFGKSDGTRYLITASSNNLKAQTATAATFTTLITTIALSVPLYATSLGDKFYFINTVDGLKSWDGTTVTVSSAALKADKITTYQGRLAIGDVTGNARVIYLSKYLDGTTLVAPANPSEDDATQITVNGSLDEGIEGLYVFQNKLMVFKPNSFSALSGSRRSNFALRSYSDFVGLSGQESIQDCDGRLRWLARGRKVFEFDGSTFHKITEDVDNLFGSIAQGDFASRHDTQTSATDFGNGSFSDTTYVDTDTVAGSIQFTYPDNFTTDFRDGTLGTKNVWTKYESGTVSGSVGVSGGTLNLNHNGGALGRENVYTTKLLSDFKQGTTYHFVISSMTPNAIGLSSLYFTLRPAISVSPSNPDNPPNASVITFTSTTSSRLYISGFTLGGVSSFTATDFSMPTTVDFFLSTTTYKLTVNGSSVAFSGTHNSTTGGQYAYFGYLKGSAGAGAASIDDFGIAPETFTFTSQPISVGTSITAWGSVSISDSKTVASTISYVFDAQTTPVFPSYTTIVNGQVPSDTVAAYASFQASFVQSTWTAQARFDDFTTNWTEGSSIKLASAYFNQRYWLSVAISSTANNYILVYDKVGQWQKWFNMNADALVIHNSKIYFGNSTGIYQAETGYTDNGLPISAYYTTSTLFPTGIDVISSFNKLYLTTEYSDATLTPTYQINNSGTYYSFASAGMNDSLGIQNLKFPFSSSEVQLGRYLNLKLSVSGSSFWRIINANIYYQPGLEPE